MIPHESETDPLPGNSLRLGLEARDHYSGFNYGSIASLLIPSAEKPSIQPPPHKHTYRHPPFLPNPLPMPLDDMVMPSKKNVQRDDSLRIIRVAGYASLAGR
jgi:hypothetical protein